MIVDTAEVKGDLLYHLLFSRGTASGGHLDEVLRLTCYTRAGRRGSQPPRDSRVLRVSTYGKPQQEPRFRIAVQCN